MCAPCPDCDADCECDCHSDAAAYDLAEFNAIACPHCDAKFDTIALAVAHQHAVWNTVWIF